MDKIFDNILVCDGSYLIHRMLHISSMFDLKNSKGDRTGGIFGFLRALNKEITVCGDYFPVICFDEGLDSRRVLVDSNYKRADEREEKEKIVLTPEEAYNDYVTQYRKQRNRLIEVLSYFGIPSIKIQGVEGDDIMYIISKMSKNSIILTDDRDMLQLLSDSCRVRRPMADELWDMKSFLEHKGYNNIYKFVVEKAISGDASDNIPGSCKGIGEKSMNDFIDLIYKFCEYESDTGCVFDFSNYPHDEISMKEFCENNNIKYKKAYTNFDTERFLSNLELVDLNKVDFGENEIQSMISTVYSCKAKVDYFKALSAMSELEIREFSVDELLEKTHIRSHNLNIK